MYMVYPQGMEKSKNMKRFNVRIPKGQWSLEMFYSNVLMVKRAQERDPNARPCTCCINKDNFRSKYGISKDISQEEIMKMLFQEKLDIDNQKMCRDGCEVCDRLKSGEASYESKKSLFNRICALVAESGLESR